MQEFSSVTASSYDAESLAPMLADKAADGWSVVAIVSAGTNVVAYLSRDTDAAASADDVAPSEVDDSGSHSMPTVEQPIVAAIPTAAPADESSTGLGAVAAGLPTTESGSTADESDAVAAAATPITPTLPGESVSAEPADTPTVDPAASAAAAAAVAAADEPAGWGAAPADNDTSVADLAAQIGAEESAGASLADAASSPAAAAVDDAAAAPSGYAETAAAPVEPEPEPVEEPAAEPAPAESSVPAGWYADPSGRFELRYWDGGAWTEHVSRAGQQYTDPPVA